MSEFLPFPQAEYCTTPNDAYGQIDDELRMYVDAPSFRRNIVGLGRRYSEAPLMNAFKKYAHLSNAARVSSTGEGEMRGMDVNFLAGSIFALHVILKTTPDVMTKRVLSKNPLQSMTGADGQEQLIEDMVDALESWNGGNYRVCFNEQEDVYQEKVTQAAARMYEDQTDSLEHEESFISGFMHSTNLIWGYARTTNPV